MAVKKERTTFEIMRDDYILKQDPEGLVGLYFREMDRINKAYEAGELDYSFEDSQFKADYWKTVRNMLLSPNDPNQVEFAKNIVKIFKTHQKECIVDAGILFDETHKNIKDGAIEGLEGLVTDDKLSNSISAMYTDIETASGKLKQNFYLEPTEALSIKGEEDKELSYMSVQVSKDALKNYKGVDDNTKKKYSDNFTTLGDNNIEVISSIIKETGSNRRLKISLDAPFKINQMPDVINITKEADDEKLKEWNEKLKKEIQILKAYESDVRGWANTAKTLRDELEQNTPKEDKESEQYKKLYAALNNASELGRNAKFINTEGKIHISDGYYDKATDYSFESLNEALEGYPNNDFKQKVASLAAEAKKKTDESVSKGADKIYREYEKITNDKRVMQSELLQRDLNVVEAEQNRRIINNDEEGKKKINALNGEITKRTKQIDNIAYFRIQARTSLLSVQSSFNFFDKDSAKRNLTSQKDQKKHKDYLDMVEKSNAVKDIDFYNENPKDIIDRLKKAKESADRYVDSHVGWRHLGSGFREDGQDRIEKAKRISKNLEREIERLQPLADSLSDDMLKGVSIADWQEVLQKQNADFRNEIKATKQKILSDAAEKNKIPLVVGIPLNMKNKSGGGAAGANEQHDEKNNLPVDLDAELKTARETVQKSAHDNGGLIDKEECMDALSRIATIASLKYDEKKSKKSTNYTKSFFDAEVDKMKNGEKFKRVVDVSNPKQLYNRSVEDKDLLRWIPDLNAAKNAIASENQVKAEASKKRTIKNITLSDEAGHFTMKVGGK